MVSVVASEDFYYMQFEASENKAAIVAYSAAAFGALWVSEW